MVERVLDLEKIEIGKSVEFSSHIKYDYVKWYANFLSEPLNIGMFVPAIFMGGKWEVLEEPKWANHTTQSYKPAMHQFQQAKDNVIFEGLKFSNSSFEYEIYSMFGESMSIEIKTKHIKAVHSESIKTIQDLIKYSPTLTAKGLKDSGLK